MLKRLIMVGAMFGLAGCATLESARLGFFKSSALENQHPASEALSPPHMLDENGSLDPLYVRSKADYHFAMAESYSLAGEPERAIEEFKLTLVYDPESTSVHMRLASEYVKLGLMSEGLEQAELAAESDPSSVEARLLLGGLYTAVKMYDRAVKYYQDAMILDGNNQEIPLYIGGILAEQKKYNEALAHFSDLAEKKGNESAHLAYFYMGRVYLEMAGDENAAKAQEAFEKSLSKKPDFVDSALALYAHHVTQKQSEKGVRLLLSFQDKFGPDPKVARELSQYYLDKEDYDKAIKHLEVLEGFDVDNLNVKLKIALILIEQKKYESAANRLEEIIALEPTSDKVRFYLGAVYEELKNYKAAIEHFSKIGPGSTYFAESVIHVSYLYKLGDSLGKAEKAIVEGIRLREDIPQLYAFYASLLDETRQYKKALDLLVGAVKKFPDHVQIRFFLGSMYDRMGAPEKSIEHMRFILEKEPQHSQALNFLAYTYAEMNTHLDEAEEMAQRALKEQPGDAFIMDTLGWVLFKQDRTKEAVKYLEAAYKLKPEESILAEHLGDAYYRLQMVQKAREMYIKASDKEEDRVKAEKIRSKILAVDQEIAKEPRAPASLSPLEKKKGP